MTPLGRTLADLIRREGPISIARYMEICLTDPEQGYYTRGEALGARGDFITAPEISQIFGELLGLWAAVVWQSMGSPSRSRLVEMGPGRGTMMRDMLRAARRVPGFLAAAEVVLIETSPVLRRLQHETLADVGVLIRHETTLAALEPGVPTIALANELVDALPAEQLVVWDGVWHRRMIGVDGAGALKFTTVPLGEQDALRRRISAAWRVPPAAGGILTLSDLSIVNAISGFGGPTAALLIDYGQDAPALGDTLQAVQGHRFVDPLAAPGTSDLSVAVDFHALAEAARGTGRLLADGPVPQAVLLGRLGIIERASRLMDANPGEAGTIEASVARLMDPAGMGARFKVIGLRTSDVPPLAGLEACTTCHS